MAEKLPVIRCAVCKTCKREPKNMAVCIYAGPYAGYDLTRLQQQEKPS